MVNLSLLDANPLVVRYEVSEFRPLEYGLYYRCEVLWHDGSRFFAREYSTETKRVYSFHWQEANDRLRLRSENYGNASGIPHNLNSCHSRVGGNPAPTLGF